MRNKRTQITRAKLTYADLAVCVCFVFGVVLVGISRMFFPIIFLAVPFLALAIAYFFATKRYSYFALTLLALFMMFLFVEPVIATFAALICLFLSGGIVFGITRKSHIEGAAFSLLIAAVGALLPVIIFLAGHGFSSSSFVVSFIESNENAQSITVMSEIYYEVFLSDALYQKIDPLNNGYKAETVRHFKSFMSRWGDEDLFYNLLWYASMAALVLFYALNSAVRSQRLADDTTKTFLKTDDFELLKVRLNRRFLLYVLFPMLLLSFFGYIEALTYMVAGIFNAVICVPCCVAALILGLDLFLAIESKPIKITMLIILALLALSSVIFSLVVLLLSMFGLADAFLDIRKLMNYALGKTNSLK